MATQAAATAVSTASSHRSVVLSTYRTLLRYARRLPDSQRSRSLSELRETYRRNADVPPDSAPPLVEEAGKRIAFLRISTPKARWDEAGLGTPGAGGQSGETRWVYKSGEGEEGGKGTPIKAKNVVSNWDGKNLDPCSVKHHYQNLKRAGFVNNLHAKGLF